MRPHPSHIFVLFAALCVAAFTFYAPTSGAGAEERPDDAAEIDIEPLPGADSIAIVYQGTLQNEDGDPVSAILPLSFHLYRGSMSATPMWSETHFVSVVDGRYQVPLGYQSELREHLIDGERWLGIELDGETEILRDRLEVRRPDGDESKDIEAGQRVSHADVADRAVEAERARLADNALALDGMTAEDIEDTAELALRRLGEHIADPDAHQAVTGPAVGGRTRILDERAGGSGGSPYDIRCPEDHVVVGIEGNAGRVVDNITIICSPLE